MHPTLALTLWLCGIVLVQRLPIAILACGLAVAAVVCAGNVRSAWIGLVVRSRWLFLILAATTLFLFPGESLRPGFPVTWEGLRLAFDQALRLLSVLYAVAWLLARWSSERLVTAFWGAATLSGLPVARQAALRLALTLEEAGTASRNRILWREVLDQTAVQGGEREESETPMSFPAIPLGISGGAGVAFAILCTAVAWWALP